MGGDDTDQHEHDQSDPFLPIIGTMDEADGHCRDHQHQTIPERGVFFADAFFAQIRRGMHG